MRFNKRTFPLIIKAFYFSFVSWYYSFVFNLTIISYGSLDCDLNTAAGLIPKVKYLYCPNTTNAEDIKKEQSQYIKDK